MANGSQAYNGFMVWIRAKMAAVPLPLFWSGVDFLEDDEEPADDTPTRPRVQFERGPQEKPGRFQTTQFASLRVTVGAVTLPDDDGVIPPAQAMRRFLEAVETAFQFDELIPAYHVTPEGVQQGRGCFYAQYTGESPELSLDKDTSQRVLSFELVTSGGA